MTTQVGIQKSPRVFRLRAAGTLVLGIASMAVLFTVPPAQAQTFTVIHTFTGSDGAYPAYGLAMDRLGNYYGTTFDGGANNQGAVFKLRQTNENWLLYSLYNFTGGADGNGPGGITVTSNGALYGTTDIGYLGAVWQLRPDPRLAVSVLQPWTLSTIHSCTGAPDCHDLSSSAALLSDRSGNLYGVSSYGGQYDAGAVYELTPSGGSWTYTTLYSFQNNGTDGYLPNTPLNADAAGNLYGLTYFGGTNNSGTVYELSPSGSGWTEQVLHSFDPTTDGYFSVAQPVMDPSGNLYGTTFSGGPNQGGTVFELSPSNGSWDFTMLYAFPGSGGPSGPYGGVVIDSSGNLYGTTAGAGPYNCGNIFELSPTQGGWDYSDLYDFTCGSDGGEPIGSLVMDSAGNLYGNANFGGADNYGTVFKLTP